MIVEVDVSAEGVSGITVDGKSWKPTEDIPIKPPVENVPRGTLANEFAKRRGATEYEGVVETIQKWYYGSLVKASWCATSLSYFAYNMNILEQFGGKHENVFNMMKACQKFAPHRFYSKDNIPDKILSGDVLFWQWEVDKPMSTTSSKHVNVAEYDSTGDVVFGIGGNQKNKICTLEYARNSQLYALYRPYYS